jgi:hypothetical protein
MSLENELAKEVMLGRTTNVTCVPFH